MIHREYTLSKEYDEKDEDIISKNISKKRRILYRSIVAFYKQENNNGYYAEDILTTILDGVNLNYIHMNHPHVDVVSEHDIKDFCKKNEIISVKSSITEKSLNIITQCKSIKLESVFSYILFSISNFNEIYISELQKSKMLLNKSIEIIGNYYDVNNESEKKIYQHKHKMVVNLVLYYLTNKYSEEKFYNDLDIISKINDASIENITLSSGRSYLEYYNKIDSEIKKLTNPISLGLVYMIDKNTCVIEKTNSIPFCDYWNRILRIWIEGNYFNNKNKVIKYLNKSNVIELFGNKEKLDINTIQISIDGYTPKELIKKDKIRVDKAYISTKYKNSDFKDKDEDVYKYFSNVIDILEKDPDLITKFNDFITSNKYLESKFYKFKP